MLARAFVAIGDINGDAAKAVAAELGAEHAVGVTCDVRKWDEQLALFETAIASSPKKQIDIAIANAGLGGANDSIMVDEDPDKVPSEPDLKVIDVNLRGAVYTTRLATHYFKRLRKQNPSSDGCLILKGSTAGYIDWPRSRQYPATKAAIRDLMKCMRHTSLDQGTRVNVVAPAYVPDRIPGSSEKAD